MIGEIGGGKGAVGREHQSHQETLTHKYSRPELERVRNNPFSSSQQIGTVCVGLSQAALVDVLPIIDSPPLPNSSSTTTTTTHKTLRDKFLFTLPPRKKKPK